MEQTEMTVGRYLVSRLEELGLKHVFGVPGDYVLKFFDLLEESSMELVNTCTELNAGYAADAYARLFGVGVACITYGVGAFSIYNAVAGAYAERVPLVIISGGPKLTLRGRLHPFLLHHTLGDMTLQRDIFEKVTQRAVVLTSHSQAGQQIDEALAACLSHSRPVYIEIPADMVGEPCLEPAPWRPDLSLHVDTEVLEEALEETLALIRKASYPVILTGVEAFRLRANDALLSVVEHTGFPVATTALGKGAIPEDLPGFVGTYVAALANEQTRRVVEGADLLLCLGAWMTDLNLGGYTAHLDPARMVIANSDRVKVKQHIYEHIPIKEFLDGLDRSLVKSGFSGSPTRPVAGSAPAPYVPVPEARLTTDRFWSRMNYFIADGDVVVADTGSITFESLKLTLPGKADYLSQAFYASVGYGTPAALGAKLAAPRMRPVVFVGDGAFQMTGQELSTIIRHGQNPIIFLLNNDGYQVERVIYDNLYNNLQMWDYTLFPEAYGGARGTRVVTEGELEEVLRTAREQSDGLVFAEIRLDRFDFSETLKQIGEKLR